MAKNIRFFHTSGGTGTTEVSHAYTYDANGNPQRIYFTNGNVTRYVHGATGEKLRVAHYTANPNITNTFGVRPAELTPSQILYADSTDYLLGGSLVMMNGAADKYLFEGGFAKRSSSSGSFSFFYYNRDHLGNNREVEDNRGAVRQVTSYYPSGVPYADASAVLGADVQPYKYNFSIEREKRKPACSSEREKNRPKVNFSIEREKRKPACSSEREKNRPKANGKELDRMHGLDTYDYGARQYDPILGRWDRMDPLCEKYYSVSPYAYCANNPVRFIDPDGKKIVLKGSQEERMKMLNYIQKLTNDNLFVVRKTGEVTIGGKRWGNRNKKLDVGTSLLRDVIGHDLTTEIQIGSENDKNRYHAYFPQDRSNGKGTSGYINLNPSIAVGLMVQDSNAGNTIVETVPMEITVGHELIHAYHAMNGNTPNEDNESSYIYKDVDGKKYEAQSPTRELETVGLVGNNKYTENKLRKEHGLNKRVAY